MTETREPMPTRVICPVCQAGNLKSQSQYVVGSSHTKCSGGGWDENGDPIPYNVDVWDSHCFKCSRGHEFRMVSTNGGEWAVAAPPSRGTAETETTNG